MAKKLTGNVLWCNYHKGYGEIEAGSKERFFFLTSTLNSKIELRENDTVSFSEGSFSIFDRPTAQDINKVTRPRSSVNRKRGEVSL